jgi:hypothetical protein
MAPRRAAVVGEGASDADNWVADDAVAMVKMSMLIDNFASV